MRSSTKLFLAIFLTAALLGCQSESQYQYKDNPNLHQVVIKEVQQTTSYTYLFMKEGGKEYWAAIPRMDVQVGKIYYYDGEMEMAGFYSRELDKTFEVIYFLENISDEPFAAQKLIAPGQEKGSPTSEKKSSISIHAEEGSVTIAQLFANMKEYEGKIIKITGQVVKYNSAILNKNWAHLQDGTEHDGNYDITITTTDQVKVGDIATFEGTVVLDKDFGAGYLYEMLIEDAVLLNER